MTDGTDGQIAALERRLRDIGTVAIAVSGGVDSMTLAFVAHRILGAKATMFHATSPAVPPEAGERVRRHGARHGWSVKIISAGEFDDPAYLANPVNRCFFCKTNLYGAIARHTQATIASGTNLDDLGDYRPGLQAARDHGVRHPFVEAEIPKHRHRHRQVVVMEQPQRFVATAVVDLMVEMARQMEQAAFPPLEGFSFAAVFIPHRGQPLALQHIDQLADREFHGLHRLAGRDLHHPGLGDAFHALQVKERRHGLALFPPAELDGAQILHMVAGVNRHADGLHPQIVGHRAPGSGRRRRFIHCSPLRKEMPGPSSTAAVQAK